MATELTCSVCGSVVGESHECILCKKICSLVLWERQPYMLSLFPYKEMIKALNLIASETIHRNFIKRNAVVSHWYLSFHAKI